MKNRFVCCVQTFDNIFRLTAIAVLICIIAIANFSNAFADAHETEVEIEIEEKPEVTGWFQIDVDTLGTYFLVGAAHPIGGIVLDSNVRLADSFGEFDIGVPFPIGLGSNATLILLPKIGIGFDYTTADGPDALFPQIFAFLPAGKFFGFHWTIGTVSSIFDSENSDLVYTRNYLTYALNETVAIGPQVEAVIGFGEGGGVWDLNFGGRLNINYGANNILGLYAGYETQKLEGETGLTGRLNFTRTW